MSENIECPECGFENENIETEQSLVDKKNNPISVYRCSVCGTEFIDFVAVDR